MTRNNKMVLGVAAGVAALAVAGMYANKKGYLKNINADSLKSKFDGLKDTAMKAFNGSNSNTGLNSGNSMNTSSIPSDNAKRKSTGTAGMSSGSTSGNINPATT